MEDILYVLRLLGLLIAGLSVLIVIHEFGHYLPARLFGMRVEKFYLFFDWPRKLFSKKIGDTEYGVGMIPLGGYVKISGIIDENMDKEQMQGEPQPWEFRSKPVWQRAIVMVGGVTMNVILGIIIFAIVAGVYGEEKIPNDKVDAIYVSKGSIGDSLGFKTGDKLLRLQGEKVKYFNEANTPAVFVEGEVTYVVERNGKKVTIKAPSGMLNYATEVKDDFVKSSIFRVRRSNTIKVKDREDIETKAKARKLGIKDGDRIVAYNGKKIEYYNQYMDAVFKQAKRIEEKSKSKFSISVMREIDGKDSVLAFDGVLKKDEYLGLKPMDKLPVDTLKYGFGGSIARGTEMAFESVTTNLSGLYLTITGQVDARKALSGPKGIAEIFDQATTTSGLKGFLKVLGLISMVLAVMNILPIPALDGGHLVFLGIEAITGKEPSLRVREIAQQVGMIILLSLMAFVVVNDFLK